MLYFEVQHQQKVIIYYNIYIKIHKIIFYEIFIDWLQDLSELLCSAENYCNGCEVHCGFQETEEKAFPLVLDAVNKLHAMFPTYGIVITGHSLVSLNISSTNKIFLSILQGAAIGTLVSLDLIALKLGVPISLHNYGSPRIGMFIFIKSSFEDIFSNIII